MILCSIHDIPSWSNRPYIENSSVTSTLKDGFMKPYLKALKRYILRLPEKFSNLVAKFATSMLKNGGLQTWNPPADERKKP